MVALALFALVFLIVFVDTENTAEFDLSNNASHNLLKFLIITINRNKNRLII